MSGMELKQGEAWPSFGECEGVFISFKLFSPPMAIRVDTTVTDGHRQGKRLEAYKYPLTFLK